MRYTFIEAYTTYMWQQQNNCFAMLFNLLCLWCKLFICFGFLTNLICGVSWLPRLQELKKNSFAKKS